MIDTRYAPLLCLLIVLSGVPTVIHTYAGARHEERRTAAAVPALLDGFEGTATNRRPDWVRRVFAAEDWIERTYRANDAELTLFIARSYDPKRLYHHPELALARGIDIGRAHDVMLAPDLPVKVLRADREGLALYALLHAGRAIDDPYWFQLRSAFEQLFTPRKPMTLVFVLDRSAPANGPVKETPAARLLVSAVRSFVGQ